MIISFTFIGWWGTSSRDEAIGPVIRLHMDSVISINLLSVSSICTYLFTSLQTYAHEPGRECDCERELGRNVNADPKVNVDANVYVT